MSFKIILGALLLGSALAAAAETRVFSVPTFQTTTFSDDLDLHPGRVAIDGNFAIVITNRVEGGRVATLYRRGSNGQWSVRATLLTVAQVSTLPEHDDLVMANGVAALRIGILLHIFERSGDTYVESETGGTPQGAPGMAISGRSILVARRGCNYDADLHQKSSTSGVWNITARLRGPAGECNDHGAPLDLDGNVALVRVSPTEIREYRREGATWIQVGTIMPPPGANFSLGAPTLSGDVAFVSEGRYFLREGTSWTFQGRVEPLDSATGTAPAAADYRGGLLLSRSMGGAFRAEASPYLYLRNSAGGFDHVAVLETLGGADYFDVSGNLAVASYQGLFGDINLSFFDLPASLRAPAAIANDFETRDVSGWQQEPGSQFALTNAPIGVLYRQSSLVDKSTAFLTASDWTYSQSIEADITPRAVSGSAWVGLAVRYLDANNHYYVTLRNSNRIELRRIVDGAFETLAGAPMTFELNRRYHVKLIANSSVLSVYVDNRFVTNARDETLTQGRAALLTFRTRADFDNVYVGSTSPFVLADMDFSEVDDGSREFTTQGGTWTIVEQSGRPDIAFGQTDPSGAARAFVGAPTGDQVVEAMARVDTYSPAGGWFGLLARWVDESTFYYLAARSSGRLDIRKKANGTITVLRSVPFSATPGVYYRFKLAVVGNQLHAYVNDVFVGGAVDGDIAEGQYGLATSNAAARWQNFSVEKP